MYFSSACTRFHTRTNICLPAYPSPCASQASKQLLLQRRSGLLFRGTARYQYRHGIARCVEVWGVEVWGPYRPSRAVSHIVLSAVILDQPIKRRPALCWGRYFPGVKSDPRLSNLGTCVQTQET